MLEHTRPATLDADGSADPWGAFRVDHPGEALALLRQLRDASQPLVITTPDGQVLQTQLWAIDDRQRRLNFAADEHQVQLSGLVEADEAVAVAYLDAVKLQFDLHGLVLVRGVQGCVLQCEWPAHLYRFQRRDSFRVRTLERHGPKARLRHPAIADMQLALRVLDVSAGGCALFLPSDVPPLEPGVRVQAVEIELDADTRFLTALQLHHVTAFPASDRGVRIGCEWVGLDPLAARTLQRYIDQTQKRRRLMPGG